HEGDAVCFPAVRASVLDSLNRQRGEGQLCDLSIHVQGQVFRAHRCVLAASSPYFHDQVLLKNVTTVSLPSVMDPVAFESVLISAYTGQLSIVQDDIVNYVTVASFLQMWHIVDKCTEILKRPHFNTVSKSNEGPVVKVNVDDVKVLRDGSCDVPESETVPGPSARLQWQMPPWSHQTPRSQESEHGRINSNEEDTNMGHFGEGNFSQDTFDEIEKESGQVTQRPLVSPDFSLPGSDGNWPSTSNNQGPSLTPTSSSTFLAPSSPPMPSSMRDRHVKMQHLNLRPFGCPVCNKSFKMKHHLTKHLKTHGGLRPFECGVCGKKVIWKDSFLRHQARCQRRRANQVVKVFII
uniref:Spalt-like transcription factor 3b n=1 Tax=Neogobius melanostomus TaxID=47308 RepID=A0A8C6UTZ6_9GOBI